MGHATYCCRFFQGRYGSLANSGALDLEDLFGWLACRKVMSHTLWLEIVVGTRGALGNFTAKMPAPTPDS